MFIFLHVWPLTLMISLLYFRTNAGISNTDATSPACTGCPRDTNASHQGERTSYTKTKDTQSTITRQRGVCRKYNKVSTTKFIKIHTNNCTTMQRIHSSYIFARSLVVV